MKRPAKRQAPKAKARAKRRARPKSAEKGSERRTFFLGGILLNVVILTLQLGKMPKDFFGTFGGEKSHKDATKWKGGNSFFEAYSQNWLK